MSADLRDCDRVRSSAASDGYRGQRLYVGGSWSAYWFNGRIYSSEIARGLDVLRLVPSEHLSAAEIAAAEAVTAETINPQTQTRIVWADTPDVAAAYLDQLTRVGGVEAGLAGQVQAGIVNWGRVRAEKRRAGGALTARSSIGMQPPNIEGNDGPAATFTDGVASGSVTYLRGHQTGLVLVCPLLLDKKEKQIHREQWTVIELNKRR